VADVQVYEISLREDEELAALSCASSLAEEWHSVESQDFSKAALVTAQELPRRLREGLIEFRVDEPAPVCRIKGWRVSDDDIGRTPSRLQKRTCEVSLVHHEMFFFLCASLLGDPFSWASTQDGHLIQEILPVAENMHCQLGTSSESELTWHTEDGFHPFRPDYVGLFCLRNPDHVATTVVTGDCLDLPQEWHELLAMPLFVVSSDYSHSADGARSVAERQGIDEQEFIRMSRLSHELAVHPNKVAVLYGDLRRPYLVANSCYMEQPEDERAREAIVGLIEGLDGALSEIVMEPGEILFIDNYRAAHGRRPFVARYDGTDRWLKRINVTRDLRKSRSSRSSPSSRIIY